MAGFFGIHWWLIDSVLARVAFDVTEAIRGSALKIMLLHGQIFSHHQRTKRDRVGDTLNSDVVEANLIPRGIS